MKLSSNTTSVLKNLQQLIKILWLKKATQSQQCLQW